eukprot:CAMPEP_0174828968 /NCGR_PEP_ID=MMETSP1114-20130205/1643_1 /TAXON_ID=312471 /ORGANISM="Neobodo designis, Strain CCAP 1951/1" /LENGTH=306 /DNA_ID=CAMNT_0016062701 /DNA_START=125 /DNA_END=1042 /DNA_ORIENTATION=+
MTSLNGCHGLETKIRGLEWWLLSGPHEHAFGRCPPPAVSPQSALAGLGGPPAAATTHTATRRSLQARCKRAQCRDAPALRDVADGGELEAVLVVGAVGDVDRQLELRARHLHAEHVEECDVDTTRWVGRRRHRVRQLNSERQLLGRFRSDARVHAAAHHRVRSRRVALRGTVAAGKLDVAAQPERHSHVPDLSQPAGVVDRDLALNRIVRGVDAARQRHGEVARSLIGKHLGQLGRRLTLERLRRQHVAPVDRGDDGEVVVAFFDVVAVDLHEGDDLVLDLCTARRPVRSVHGLREVHRQLERERV